MRKRLIWWWKIIKQYLCNTSIHGVRYLVENQFSYVERFFWLISCILSWVACGYTVYSVINNFITNPVAVTAETMYLDWQTPFPSIIFCISHTKTMKSKYIKSDPKMLSPSVIRINATGEDFQKIYSELKVPCTEFLHSCMWNNVKFNCCDEFKELEKTGMGHCIALNSDHTGKNGESGVKFFLNRTVQYGDLIIDVDRKQTQKLLAPGGFNKYIINNQQVPILIIGEYASVGSLKDDHLTRIEFTMQTIYNEEGVRKIPIERRNCRFQDELMERTIFNVYSLTSCFVDVTIQRMIETCGCVHFLYGLPHGARICNVTEINCIFEKKVKILPHQNSAGMCLPNCEGTVISTNHFEPMKQGSPGSNYARLHYTLLNHPTIRYRRYVVNDILDVIVSVGSALGLFMGASILTIFEIPYWLFIRRDRIP